MKVVLVSSVEAEDAHAAEELVRIERYLSQARVNFGLNKISAEAYQAVVADLVARRTELKLRSTRRALRKLGP